MFGLRFCARAFSSCGKWGPLFIAVRGPLTIAASLVAEHRLQTCRLSSCGSRAPSLCGMWDPPRPGLEPVFPALADRLSTTAPPGKPFLLKKIITNALTYFTQECYSVSQKLKGKAVCGSLVICTWTNLFVCRLMERTHRIWILALSWFTECNDSLVSYLSFELLFSHLCNGKGK